MSGSEGEGHPPYANENWEKIRFFTAYAVKRRRWTQYYRSFRHLTLHYESIRVLGNTP